MDRKKQIKGIKITAIILMAIGGLMILSNLPAFILMNLSENFSAEIPSVDPIYFVLNGTLLLIAGLLLTSQKKWIYSCSNKCLNYYRFDGNSLCFFLKYHGWRT